MAKKNNNTIIWILVIVVALFMFSGPLGLKMGSGAWYVTRSEAEGQCTAMGGGHLYEKTSGNAMGRWCTVDHDNDVNDCGSSGWTYRGTCGGPETDFECEDTESPRDIFSRGSVKTWIGGNYQGREYDQCSSSGRVGDAECPVGGNEVAFYFQDCPNNYVCNSGKCIIDTTPPGCTPDCSGHASVCEGDTFLDPVCGSSCIGSLQPICQLVSDVTCGVSIQSTNNCSTCSGSGTACISGLTCISGECIDENSAPIILLDCTNCQEIEGDIVVGEQETVKVTFKANQILDQVVLEAQIQSVDEPKKTALQIGVNRCDRDNDNPLWRNEFVSFTSGQEREIEFIFTPPHAGWFDIYVDVVSSCGLPQPDLLSNQFVGSFFVEPEEEPDGLPINETTGGVPGVTPTPTTDDECLEDPDCEKEGKCKSSDGECKKVCAPWQSWNKDNFKIGKADSGCELNLTFIFLGIGLVFLIKFARG